MVMYFKRVLLFLLLSSFVRGESELDVPPPSPRRVKLRFRYVDYPDILPTLLNRSVCRIFLLRPDSLFVCPNVAGLGRLIYHSKALEQGAVQIVGSYSLVYQQIDLYSDYYDNLNLTKWTLLS